MPVRSSLLIVLMIAVTAPALAQQPLTKNWTTSKITGSPQPPSPFVTERIFPSLSFAEPCELVAVPGTNRLLVIEVKGKLYTFENKPDDENLQPELFADVTQLDPTFFRVYGIAFHPKFGDSKFPDQRYCYI